MPIVETTPVTVTPVTVTPEQSEANWQRAYPFVLNMEGGLSTDRNDKGNYTPSGEFRHEVRDQRSPYPHLDIANPDQRAALDTIGVTTGEPSGLLLRRGRCAWRLTRQSITGRCGETRVHARQLRRDRTSTRRSGCSTTSPMETWPHHGVAWKLGAATFAGSEKA